MLPIPLAQYGNIENPSSFNTRGSSLTIQLLVRIVMFLVFKIPSYSEAWGKVDILILGAITITLCIDHQEVCVVKCGDSARTGDGVAPMPLNQRCVD